MVATSPDATSRDYTLDRTVHLVASVKRVCTRGGVIVQRIEIHDN
jgi:hypothetical protein